MSKGCILNPTPRRIIGTLICCTSSWGGLTGGRSGTDRGRGLTRCTLAVARWMDWRGNRTSHHPNDSSGRKGWPWPPYRRAGIRHDSAPFSRSRKPSQVERKAGTCLAEVGITGSGVRVFLTALSNWLPVGAMLSDSASVHKREREGGRKRVLPAASNGPPVCSVSASTAAASRLRHLPRSSQKG